MTRPAIKKLILITAVAMTLMSQPSVSAQSASDSDVLAASQQAVGYLSANQNDDGSISGYPGTTDWAVMAIAATDQDVNAFSNGGQSVTSFLAADVPTATANATDIERKIIAIAAADQDSQNFGGINYNAKLADFHTDGQIGDPTLINDDIFGVIAVVAAQDTTLYDTAQDGLNYLVAHQSADGGFSYTTNTCDFYCGSDSNDTAAAIVALQAANSIGLLNDNLTVTQASALAYLLSTQQADGGFGYDVYSPSDGSSTAWGLIALNSIGDAVGTQARKARDWLLAHQNSDGGFGFVAYNTMGSDTYTTSHALLALLGTTWLIQPDPIHAEAEVPVIAGNTSGQTPTTASNNTGAGSTPNDQTEEPAVLGAQTTNQVANQAQPTEDIAKPHESTTTTEKSDQNSSAMYASIALGLVALAWYVIQLIRKRQEA